jgi:hypothetical protein
MFGDELVYSSSDDASLSIYAAKRSEGGALTLLVVNLSAEAREKALVVSDQPTARAEAWLFDPDHEVENMGEVELGGEILFPAQSVTLFVLK